MLRKTILLGIVILIIAGGVVAYAVFKPPDEASAPIQAIPLDADGGSQPNPTAVGAEPTLAPTQQPDAASEATDAPTSEQDVAPTPAVAAVQEAGAGSADTADPTVFSIVPEQSEVRFLIDEVLRGADNTVVGSTDQVAGELAVDPSNPAGSRVGTILINARTLATDSSMRDRAIKNRILNTNSYEFITFVPTQLDGLPASATVGESYDFQITGDLTIRDVTQQVTFAVSVTALSETELQGTASTTIMRGDFGLAIPNVPSVSFVAEEVILEIDFVAAAG
jgi:polyisoprenoid-binding protein YceI